jgi:hypothetical protein
MSIINDIVSRVTDPYRNANPAPSLPHVHGASFQSPSPAVAGYVEQYPAVSDALGRVQSAIALLGGRYEGALLATGPAREAFDSAKAAEAVAHHDARESGRAVDPVLAKRLLRARQTAERGNEEAAINASIASDDHANTREALNAAIRFISERAGERAGLVLADPVTLPKGDLQNIIADQNRALKDIDVEVAEVRSAPIPLEDAVAIIRESIGAESPRIVLGSNTVEWIPPQQRLNVAPRLGDQPVDVDNTTALLGWLFGDVLADRLEEAVRAKYAAVERVFSPRDRQRALADLATKRLSVERIEVAATFGAWQQRLFVPLRKDVSPLALLGIARVTEGQPDPEKDAGSAYIGEGRR